jgi:cbb3-type cytochrome oxidase subunit 3
MEQLLAIEQIYLEEGDMHRLKALYDRMTTHYAGRFEGWWGYIYCATKAWTKTDPTPKELDQIETWYGMVQGMAPADRKILLTQQYNAYKASLAQRQNNVENRQLTKMEYELQDLQRRLQELKGMQKNYRPSMEKAIYDAGKPIRKHNRLCLLNLAMFFGGCGMFAFGSGAANKLKLACILLGIFFVIISFPMMFFVLDKSKRQEASNAKKNISNLKEDMKRRIREIDKDIQETENAIRLKENEIAGFRKSH